ncbi:MAG: sensor histidine kinase [Spirochaetes bacterium]|nr:MAG: sensor histidine kinase [Spirochaetota bacterium]RKX87237.1 MAG: sensor histidine kinase [Spirochaetota bacterium]RKX98032.1 MAG: sensor histidine kinase [Spirochaetota bacterium]
MTIQILKTLLNQAGLIAIFAIVISQSRTVKRILIRRKLSYRDSVVIVILFGSLGIAGTYMGVPVHGAIANSRVVGVFVAGLIGGPLVGLLTGMVAGLHRWAIDIGGFTAFACMLSTIIEGLLGGLLSKRFERVEEKWFFAMVAGASAEIMQMIIILLIVRPYNGALELVKIIAIPMIGANAIAIGIFIAILNNIRKEEDRVAANQAAIVLLIARKTIQHFRHGFNPETTLATAKIILENTDLSAVAFTDNSTILAHVGEGSVHHPQGGEFQTVLTRKAIKSRKLQIAESKEQISCTNSQCKLQSAVVIPLMQGNDVIGTLKIYREEKNAISPVDINLAKGLGSLFSTQIELRMIEEQAMLLERAELKALQAQINPHFLFNAINTIVSLVRTDPEAARTLLQNLGLFFRNSFQLEKTEVSIHQEIDQIRAYLEIEKARFADKLKVEFKIPTSLNFYLPPFLLQPLVENAVKHGIMVKRDGGEILVEARVDKKKITLTVEDNGVGMDVDQLKTLLGENNNESIALNNINKRLITKYGEKFGLLIESKKGRGTKVTICIPEIVK